MSEIYTPDGLARLFHETYERLAPEYGYKTREASAVPWTDVPTANKQLMTAVAGHVLGMFTAEPAPAAKLTPEQKLAQQIITQHGKGVPFATIVKTLEGVDGWSDLYGDEQARMVGEVDRLIGVATVTVTWPQAAEQAGEPR